MKKNAYYEDIQVGETKNFGSYTVSLDEIVSFAKKWDPQLFHIDEKAARESVFNGLSACTAHIMSIMSLLAHSEPEPMSVAAGLGMESAKMVAPLRPGDVVSGRATTTEKRPSESKSDCGIIKRRYELINQLGEVLCVQDGVVLVYRKNV